MSPKKLRILLWSLVAINLAALGWVGIISPKLNSRVIDTLGQGDYALETTGGSTFTEASLREGPSAVFFGFTHCPDVCPTTVYEIDSWFRAIGQEADEVKAFFVTVDPERDTVEFLADYLKPQSDRVVGITGEPEAVWDMARSWRVYWSKRPLGDGEYTMDHFASVYVLNRDGQLFEKISYGEDAETAIAKIRAALNS